MQGGKMLHVIDGESKLKPRIYGNEGALVHRTNSEGSTQNVMQYLEDALDQANAMGSDHVQSVSSDSLPDLVPSPKTSVQALVQGQVPQASHPVEGTPFDTDYGLQAEHRITTRKFEPLTVDGHKFTTAAIGGYTMNLERVQAKIAAFVPLPPAVLPKIFIDGDLNFFHHFMQGLEILAGRSYIVRIMEQGKYSEGDKGKILPALKNLILQGFLAGDTELTVFIKRVLSSTFDTLPSQDVSSDNDALIVSANLWGFPYIETGMTCRESDIKMWLHMAYTHYKMSWFNSFKSSGMPAFALHGVQDRYTNKELVQEKKPRSALRIDDHREPLSKEDIIQKELKDLERRVRRDRRRLDRELVAMEQEHPKDRGFWKTLKSLKESH